MSDNTGRLLAFDRSSGGQQWATLVDQTGAILGANLLAEDGIVVAASAHETIAVDAVAGQERWRYVAPDDSALVPIQPGYVGGVRVSSSAGVAYIPAWGGSLSAVDLQTGVPRWIWRFRDADGYRSGVQGARASGDTVYAIGWHFLNPLGGISEEWLVAVDQRTGTELWRKKFPPLTSGVTVNGSPVVFQNLVIFTAAGGNDFAVDRFTQDLVWTFTPNTRVAVNAEAELRDGVVYSDGGDGFLYALSAATGTVKWKASQKDQSGRDFLVTEKRIYVTTSGGELQTFDRQTGALLALTLDPLGTTPYDHLFASPGIESNDQVFFGVSHGGVCYKEP